MKNCHFICSLFVLTLVLSLSKHEVRATEVRSALEEMGVVFAEKQHEGVKGKFAVVEESETFTLTDAAPHLAKLKDLVGLHLDRCPKITNLKGIESVKSLRALTISQCARLTDISSLKGHSNLEAFHVYACFALLDAKGVEQLPKLNHFELHYCLATKDLSGLENLPSLQTLALEECPSVTQQGLRSIGKLTSLEEIRLLGSSMETRRANNLANPAIKDLSWLRGLLKLKKLDVGLCQSLESLNGLQWAKNLEEFTLSDGQVKSLAPVKSLRKLESLTVSNQTKISDASGVGGLPSLQKLKLDVALVTKPILTSLPKLQQLTIGGEVSKEKREEIQTWIPKVTVWTKDTEDPFAD